MDTRGLIAGRFRLQEQIGAGGMGVVWRALEEPSGRTVVLKQVRTSDGAVARAAVTRLPPPS